METNNKWREALNKIAHYDESEYSMDDYNCADGHICADIARAALAAPVRNYEVGTVEDQYNRFTEFCRQHKRCDDCQFTKLSNEGNITRSLLKCCLLWSHEPYEEGGKNGNE